MPAALINVQTVSSVSPNQPECHCRAAPLLSAGPLPEIVGMQPSHWTPAKAAKANALSSGGSDESGGSGGFTAERRRSKKLPLKR